MQLWLVVELCYSMADFKREENEAILRLFDYCLHLVSRTALCNGRTIRFYPKSQVRRFSILSTSDWLVSSCA
jgi:hypothetical protein